MEFVLNALEVVMAERLLPRVAVAACADAAAIRDTAQTATPIPALSRRVTVEIV